MLYFWPWVMYSDFWPLTHQERCKLISTLLYRHNSLLFWWTLIRAFSTILRYESRRVVRFDVPIDMFLMPLRRGVLFCWYIPYFVMPIGLKRDLSYWLGWWLFRRHSEAAGWVVYRWNRLLCLCNRQNRFLVLREKKLHWYLSLHWNSNVMIVRKSMQETENVGLL